MSNIESIIAIIIMVCFFITQIMAHLPLSVTERVPNWIMVLLNLIAANYKETANDKTDTRGNSKIDQRYS